MYRIRTLGGIALERDGVALDEVGAQRKTLAFLTLLAASRGQGISRDRVAAYLWPESDTERARGALKQVLHVARRLLGSPEAVLGTSELRLNSSYVGSDIDAFLSALEQNDLERAVGMYRGHFLDGFHLPGSAEFEQWASTQRDELARRYAYALDRIASAAEERGDWVTAVEWLRRLQMSDPFSARTTVRLMRALDAAGERVAALRCAQVHQTLLLEELNSPPDTEVAALSSRLRAEDSPPTPLPDSRSLDSAPVPSATIFAPAPPRTDVAVLAGASTSRQMRRLSYIIAAAAVAVIVVGAAMLLGYDRDVRDITVIPAEIGRVVIGAFHSQNRPGTGLTSGAPRTIADREAYDLYLRGRHAWRQRTRVGIEQAIVFFEGAIERDPSFAPAYAGLAVTYVNCSNFAYCSREALTRAEVAADRALMLDADLAEGHAAKGFVLASRLEFAASESAFRRAVELNRGLTWAHHYYTLLLLMLGRTDEALAQNGQALSVDPLSLPANATRGIILLQRGDLAGAELELQRALALSPSFDLTLYYLGVTRAAQGRYDDAGQLLERVGFSSPDFTGVPGARAFVLQQTGRQGSADSLLAEVEGQVRAGNARARFNLAAAHAALGRHDSAFALFDRVEWDVPALVELRADPLLGTLRADSRYHALLQRIGAAPQGPRKATPTSS